MAHDTLKQYAALKADAIAPVLDQIVHHGFAVVPSIFEPAECLQILSDPTFNTLERSRAGARHLLKQPVVSRMAHDERLLKLASDILGGPAIPYRATLFEKTSSANWLVVWHQDTALPLCERVEEDGWGPWSTKADVLYAHAPAWALERIVALRLYLDDSRSENGPLRAIPGSHTRGVLSDPEVHQLAANSESTECLVPQGGVLAMRPLLVHASSKSQSPSPRRVIHIEYATSLHLGPRKDLKIA